MSVFFKVIESSVDLKQSKGLICMCCSAFLNFCMWALYLVIDLVLFSKPCMSHFHNHTHVHSNTNKYLNKNNTSFVSAFDQPCSETVLCTEIDSRVVEFENVDLSLSLIVLWTSFSKTMILHAQTWYVVFYHTANFLSHPTLSVIFHFGDCSFFFFLRLCFLTFVCLYWIARETNSK